VRSEGAVIEDAEDGQQATGGGATISEAHESGTEGAAASPGGACGRTASSFINTSALNAAGDETFFAHAPQVPPRLAPSASLRLVLLGIEHIRI